MRKNKKQAGPLSDLWVPDAAPAAPGIDLHALMLEVVADKNGYPAVMVYA